MYIKKINKELSKARNEKTLIKEFINNEKQELYMLKVRESGYLFTKKIMVNQKQKEQYNFYKTYVEHMMKKKVTSIIFLLIFQESELDG